MAQLYADHNVSRRLALLLSEAGHPTRTAFEEGMDRAGDEQQLHYAAQRDWVLLTHNREDFRLLHRAWLYWGQVWDVEARHAGILILEQGRLADELAVAVLQLLDIEPEMINHVHEWARATGWRPYPR